MFYEYISLVLGITKLFIYKCLYWKRIVFKSLPKMNCRFKIAIKKKSKLAIGKNFRCRNDVSFRIYNEGIVEIGDNCFFNDDCSINCQKHIRIGNNVICGQNVMLFDHDHDYKSDMNNFVSEEILIGNNVWIGANTTILKGITIGDNSVIAAGSVINRNVEGNTLVYNEIKRKERRIKHENCSFDEH